MFHPMLSHSVVALGASDWFGILLCMDVVQYMEGDQHGGWKKAILFLVVAFLCRWTFATETVGTHFTLDSGSHVMCEDMFLTATLQQRRTKHARTGLAEKSSDEKRWAGMRWEELRWDEGCSVKCGARRVQCEVWSVECEVWSVKCGVWSVKCGVQRVQCQVWSVKCEVELQMWHVEQDTTFAECTHAQAWLAHGACKFYRWERSHIYIFKATSAPPRAGTTGT